MPQGHASDVVFGPFRLAADGQRLTRDGAAVPLGRRALDTLNVLAAADGQVVGKDALLDAVWPGLTVEENNLQVQISALRKALGEGWIVTEPGRGYRLDMVARRTSNGLAPPEKPSIAVLPFANLSGDAEQQYFADGMTEEIITTLSRIRGFTVIARNSTFTYKGRAVDARQVGRELGVRYVVEGSVRKGGNRVRIAAQLADTTTGTQLWADRFDGALDDVFDLQDRVAASLIGAIEPRILAIEIERAQRKPPESLQAYDLRLRALSLLYANSRDDLLQAVGLLRRAIEAEPGYGLAQATLARCLWFHHPAGLMQQGRDPPLAIAAIGPGQRDDVRSLRRFISSRVRRLALRGAVLAQHLAGSALGHAKPGLNSLHTGAAAGGAQKFPRAASFRISLSSVRSDTARRSRIFSSSSSFSRFNWPVFMPPYSARHRKYVCSLTSIDRTASAIDLPCQSKLQPAGAWQ